MGFFTQFMFVVILVSAVSCSKSGGGGGSPKGEDRTQNPSTSPDSPTPAPTPVPVPVPEEPTPAPTPTPEPTPTPVPTPEPTPTPVPTPEPTPTPSTPTPTPAPEVVTIRANAEFIDITDEVRKDKLERAIQLLETVINTPLFKERVLAYTYNGVKAFVDNKSMTNEMVFQSILDGSETLTPGNNHMVDVQLTFYRASNSTVGYTSPTTRLIKINLKFFDQYKEPQVAGNLAHEWTHKLGFNHASSYSEKRDHSVPYAIGYLVRDMGEDILGL